MQLRLCNLMALAMFAPSGAGKTTSLIAPLLFDWSGPCVVLDVKGELAPLVAEYRYHAFGHYQAILDPFGVHDIRSDTHNFLPGLNPQSGNFIPDLKAIAEAVVIRPQSHQGDGKHFDDSAELWSVALLADCILHQPPANRHVQTLRDTMADPGALVAAIGRLIQVNDPIIRRFGQQMLSYRDRELGSVITTLNRHWNWADQHAVAHFTRQSSFDPNRLVHPGDIDIYMTIPPQYLRSQAPLLRLLITDLLRTVVRAGLDDHRSVLFVLDECAALGPLPILLDALTQYRGFGAKFVLAYQAMSQATVQFPEGVHQTVLANCDQIYFAARDYSTAEAVSNLLGAASVTTYSSQASGGWSESTGIREITKGRSGGYSESASEHSRPLLYPDEVMRLGDRQAILFAQNVRPVLFDLCRHYEDPDFRGGSATKQPLSVCDGLWSLLLCFAALFFAFCVSVWVMKANRIRNDPPAWSVPAPSLSP
jgi:type IV secretion system protein VirD4